MSQIGIEHIINPNDMNYVGEIYDGKFVDAIKRCLSYYKEHKLQKNQQFVLSHFERLQRENFALNLPYKKSFEVHLDYYYVTVLKEFMPNSLGQNRIVYIVKFFLGEQELFSVCVDYTKAIVNLSIRIDINRDASDYIKTMAKEVMEHIIINYSGYFELID